MPPSSILLLPFLSLSLGAALHFPSPSETRYLPNEVQGPQLTWARSECGFGDIPTQWGLTIDPSTTPVLPEYPRPQMVRPPTTWWNLNGLWYFQPANPNPSIPKGPLNGSILVPFPVESCLSGVNSPGGVPRPWNDTISYQWVIYRTYITQPSAPAGSTWYLHFGAIDWNSTIYWNGEPVGNHIGGYDPFYFNVTSLWSAGQNELTVVVYDPSDEGAQPNGKQRISAILDPGGDTYSPSTGIWQTVWIEAVSPFHITEFRYTPNTTALNATIFTSDVPPGGFISLAAFYDGVSVANATGAPGVPIILNIPNPMLWDPEHPYLYVLIISACTPSGCTDTVDSYFGLRGVSLGKYSVPPTPPTGPQAGIDRPGLDLPGMPVTLNGSDPNLCWALCNVTSACVAWAYGIPSCGGDPSTPQCWLKGGVPSTVSQPCRVSGVQAIPGGPARRPFINGNFTFLAGWLDQSWWPDGHYTAPTDDALESDVIAVQQFGLNAVRLHQKVNPERWYLFADVLGVVILQDMIQKYGGATAATVPLFMVDLKSMLDGKYNHPSIIQWEVFNEEDCVGVFNATQVVEWVQGYDTSRLVDTDSGGPANNLYIADVNDVHTYPYPGDPKPSATQYAMVGEYGGIGAFIPGHEWVPGQCTTYLPVDTPQDEADTYVGMASTILSNSEDISVCIYTQITDVERECDGFLNMDRTNKFTYAQQQAIYAANQQLIYGHK